MAVTLDPAQTHVDLTLSSGNLVVERASDSGALTIQSRANITKTTGKWYFEFTVDTDPSGGGNRSIGFTDPADNLATTLAHSYNFSSTDIGDVVGAAFDFDGGKAWYHKNGVWVNGNPADGTNPTGTFTPNVELAPGISMYSVGTRFVVNFGASTFAYSPPSGFSALEEAVPLLSGTVTEGGVAVARTVRVYRRDTGALLGEQTSAADGTFQFADLGGYTGEVYVIALDDDPGTAYNALVYDRVVV